jgi:peptidoglycan hydrolase CwlO-like protein
MFFQQQVEHFETLISEVKNIVLNISAKQQKIEKDVQAIKNTIKDNNKKFKACSEAFNQTKIVCEELTERICDAAGVISNL